MPPVIRYSVPAPNDQSIRVKQPLNASQYCDQLWAIDREMIHHGPLDGSYIAQYETSTSIIGGPLDGSHVPKGRGMVIGGAFDGTTFPGWEGGLIVGGPKSGAKIPGGIPSVKALCLLWVGAL